MPVVLLFDIDGTLVRCGGAGRTAMQAAFLERVGRDDVCDFGFAGMTDRLIARRGLSRAGIEVTDAAIDELLDAYLRHLSTALREVEAFEVLPGVQALLAELGGRPDVALGLGTGNVEIGARMKLARGGFGDEFRFGGFGCDHEERPVLIAAGLERGRAALSGAAEVSGWVIGDTPLDVAAAASNGIACLGVATGPYAADALLEAGASLAVERLDDPRVLPTLLGRAS